MSQRESTERRDAVPDTLLLRKWKEIITRPNVMRVESKNRAILTLDDSHPAKRFVEAFIDCRMNCAGRELDLGGQVPIDQAWTSATDGRVWTFSDFIYAFICFDIELDGFLQNAGNLTSSEIAAARELPRLRSMMNECAQAARQNGNDAILELTDQVLEMFGLWEEYLSYRKEMIVKAGGTGRFTKSPTKTRDKQ